MDFSEQYRIKGNAWDCEMQWEVHLKQN